MNDPQISGGGLRPGGNMSAKLRAALDYLGDKLTTHRASRFKPANQYLLDEWRATRRATFKRSLVPAERTGEIGIPPGSQTRPPMQDWHPQVVRSRSRRPTAMETRNEAAALVDSTCFRQ